MNVYLVFYPVPGADILKLLKFPDKSHTGDFVLLMRLMSAFWKALQGGLGACEASVGAPTSNLCEGERGWRFRSVA